MRIEDQVITFDQAALIYSHGVRIDNCLFHWCQNKHTGENKIFLAEISPPSYEWVYLFPAYTVAELGVLLGIGTRLSHDVTKCGFNDNWLVGEKFGNSTTHIVTDVENEAQARAAALIWLIENGHIKVEDLKL
jgi:hypothetical protein